MTTGDMTTGDNGPAAALAWRAWRAWAGGDVPGALVLARAAAAAARRQPRRERQQVQIVQLVLAGDTARATGLIAEHMAEFPADGLIGEVRAVISGGGVIR
jgi:hypothetical protein